MKTKKTSKITLISNCILIVGWLMMLWNFIFNKSNEQITFIAGFIMCLSSIPNIFLKGNPVKNVKDYNVIMNDERYILIRNLAKANTYEFIVKYCLPVGLPITMMFVYFDIFKNTVFNQSFFLGVLITMAILSLLMMSLNIYYHTKHDISTGGH